MRHISESWNVSIGLPQSGLREKIALSIEDIFSTCSPNDSESERQEKLCTLH